MSTAQLKKMLYDLLIHASNEVTCFHRCSRDLVDFEAHSEQDSSTFMWN